ncbi:pollen allergen Phl p 2-like [Panicum miliaceum]|uniref:Pollen allergen Phl p 2-like n=1 Tax=Panicum miliaceum TaxID=4540 RepID=A0A3L6RK24_PANMI|nr:pollen allergen Phl p 2-like [Panicum miliaceum]
MASTRSSILLAAAVLAALLAVGSCASSWLTLKAGPGCSATKLVLIPSVPIPMWRSRRRAPTLHAAQGGADRTWTLEGKAALKGPFTVRFSTEYSGDRVMDDVIPASFKSGSVYKTKQLMID